MTLAQTVSRLSQLCMLFCKLTALVHVSMSAEFATLGGESSRREKLIFSEAATVSLMNIWFCFVEIREKSRLRILRDKQ